MSLVYYREFVVLRRSIPTVLYGSDSHLRALAYYMALYFSVMEII